MTDGAKMGLGAYVEKKPPAAFALTGVAGSANGDPLADWRVHEWGVPCGKSADISRASRRASTLRYLLWLSNGDHA